MWPFKTKPEPEVPTFKGIKFGDRLYQPQDDITPHEVALMLPLFIVTYYFNRQEYIKRNNLERHFVEETNEPLEETKL